MSKTWARQHTTIREVSKNGTRTVFHRSPRGNQAWTHAPSDPCEVCEALKR